MPDRFLSDADVGLGSPTPSFLSDADVGLGQPQSTTAQDTGVLSPFTNYPGIYSQMRGEAGQQISEGLSRALGSEAPLSEQAKGLGQAALGAVGYVASPINAAYRAGVGQPVEQTTGIPAPWTDFAAQLATPGLGLLRVNPESAAAIAARGLAMPKTPPAPVPTVGELKTAAQSGYQAPELGAVELKADTLPKLANVTIADLNKTGFDENLAPKTFGILNKMTKAPDGAVVTVNNLESVRRMLGKAAGSIDPTERAAAQTAKGALDSYVEKIPQADVLAGDAGQVSDILREARGNYAAAKLGESLDTRIARAERMAEGEHSGLNLGNKLRQQVRQFLEGNESRGLNDTERSALENFISGTPTQNTMRFVGNLLGGGGGLGSVASAAVGGMAGGVPGAIAGPVTGFGLRVLGNSLTARQADQLSQLLRSRSPLARQMQASLDSWSKYATSAQSQPATPRIMAMLTIQSRNLANNLKDAGIMTTPDNIMRSLTGPMPSGAGQEQQ